MLKVKNYNEWLINHRLKTTLMGLEMVKLFKGVRSMTELLVTPKSISHIETLIELGADAFVIAKKIWLKTTGEFKEPELREAIKIIHEHGKKHM